MSSMKKAPRINPLLLALAVGIDPGWTRAASVAGSSPVGDLNPAEALKAFEVEPGFAVDLVAAEPLVIDPVALAFDELGRLWVAENRDYPEGSPDGRPSGMIAVLEDTDGDGRMDRRTVFAEGLSFPNGVMCWHGGVIVTAAPEVLWLKDTDGDGRADERRVWLTGFSLGGSSQLRVNDPTLGPDGWIYFAGGLSGGRVSVPGGTSSMDLARGDVKYDPASGRLELTDGKSQFGLAFDDAGNRFACMNRIHIQHAPLSSKVLAREPSVVPPGALQNCPELVPNRLLVKSFNSAARLFPISANLTTADSHEGTYSAACAVHIYRGGALPRAYQGAAFTCDPTANLVRGDRLVPTGGTFAAQRIHERTEALRSRDNWFRPVFLADGPDGALYVADMYRGVIEHPVYLPDEVRKRSRFDQGRDKGRIWRLRSATRPVTGLARPGVPGESGAESWVKRLGSPIPWERDTAFRRLMESATNGLVPALLAAIPKLAMDEAVLLGLPRDTEESADPLAAGAAAGRCLALNLVARLIGWTETAWENSGPRQEAPPGLDTRYSMDFLGALVAATFDASPAVRQTAFRHLGHIPGLSISDRLVEHWSADPHSVARLLVAVMLGRWQVSGSIEALGRIALRDGADRWTRAAVLCGLGTGKLHFLDRLMENPETAPDPGFMEELGRLLGPGQTPRDLGKRHWTWAGGPGNEWRWAFWAGVASGLGNRGPVDPAGPFAERVGLDDLRLRGLVSTADMTVRSPVAPLRFRMAALRFLAELPSEFDRGRLFVVFASSQPVELQRAAIAVLCRPGPLHSVGAVLEDRFWRALSPSVQGVALQVLLASPTNHSFVVAALERRLLQPSSLLPAQREVLRRSPDATVAARVGALFESGGTSDRRAAYEAAREALGLVPVPGAGRAVFGRLCAGCHRFNREGFAVGPDLFDIRNQSKETILLHLVIPDLEIAPPFTAYECVLGDDASVTGVLVSEDPASVTIRMAQGLEETLPRSRIKVLLPVAGGLMPQELEKAMTRQELADLLAYLRGE